MTIIYWFRRDRRLSDNPAFMRALGKANKTGDTLLPVTLLADNPVNEWGFARFGNHRLTFEAQSLNGLAKRLRALGSDLYQPTQTGVAGLVTLAKALGANTICCEAIDAPEEISQVQQLTDAGLDVQSLEQSALLAHDELPFEPSKTPTVFSEFRRLVEKAKCQPRTPTVAPTTLAPLPAAATDCVKPYEIAHRAPPMDARSAFPYQSEEWHGDEASGQSYIERYFSSRLPQHYKETRNGLAGTDYSTKLSPWLAVGSISAAQVWQALQQHEHEQGANDSTYWIWFELLWRDHFRLMMRRFGRKLFARSGLSRQPLPPISHNVQGFKRWCAGNTGHAFIDAAMRELSATGYLSNRMRQNAASYLIHDLGGDWRAGAAWFEHCLVDFDVNSNQGNWAYIAGVGTDPRGGRRFNPDKQAHDYDRDGSYRDLWREL